MRFRNGQTQFSKPSRFYTKLTTNSSTFPKSKEKYTKRGITTFATATTAARPRNLKPLAQIASTYRRANTYGLKIGDKITHLTFGEGTDLDITSSGDSIKPNRI